MDHAVLVIVCFTPIACALLVGALMVAPMLFAEIKTCLAECYVNVCLSREIKNVRACIRQMANGIKWYPKRAVVGLTNEVFSSRMIFIYLTNDEKNLIMEAASDYDNPLKLVYLIANILERIETSN